MRWAEWVEPYGPNSEPVYMRVPETTAIAIMQNLAGRRGSMYGSPESAFEDFVAAHWATVTEEK